MTVAQLVILAKTGREMQRQAEQPQAHPATMMDAAMLARAAAVTSG